MNRLATLTAEDFAPFLGEEFELLAAGEPRATLRLSSIDVDETGATSTGQRASFAILFESEHRDVTQGIYTLAHAELGSIDLFLVPVLSDKPAYEAVFN